MKYFVTTDIHSCYSVLKNTLDQVGFNSNQDTLISLGDNFDRGNESWEMYQFLSTLPYVILIKGNHEDLFVDMVRTKIVHDYDVSNGTLKTLSNIGKHCLKDKYSTYDILNSIQETPFFKWITSPIWKDYVILGDYLFTHAAVPNSNAPL